METLGIKDLAEILKKSRYSIATDVTKAPHKLPPRLMLPGNRRVLWLRSDVEKWLNAHRLVPVSELISK
jgi:predicted DNA-binding transcriptional regulator AlpA